MRQSYILIAIVLNVRVIRHSQFLYAIQQILAWNERLPVKDGIYHANYGSAHLDEHLPPALVSIS